MSFSVFLQQQKGEKKMNKKVITMCATGVLLGALAIGGTFAYLTDNETTTNNFTVGHVQIDLIESRCV